MFVLSTSMLVFSCSRTFHSAEAATESPRCSDVECAINLSRGDWYSSDTNSVPPRVGISFPSLSVSNRDGVSLFDIVWDHVEF